MNGRTDKRMTRRDVLITSAVAMACAIGVGLLAGHLDRLDREERVDPVPLERTIRRLRPTTLPDTRPVRVRDALAGRLRHQCPEIPVRAQGVHDGLRVRVEVQQPPAAGNRGGQVAEVVQHQRAPDMIGFRCETDDSIPRGQPQRPPIGTVAYFLNARDRGRGATLMSAYGDVRVVPTATGTTVTIERRWRALPPSDGSPSES
jgi:hypothetical protein